MCKTILAVDDMPSTLAVITSVFASDYQVIKKKNGLEALNWIKEGNLPDAIITDLKMPQMDGYEFIAALKANQLLRHIPILVLSGTENSSERLKCLKLGAMDYLRKPYNPDELKFRTENMMERSYSWDKLGVNEVNVSHTMENKKETSILNAIASMIF